MGRYLPLILATLLAACGGNPPRAPVEDRNIRRAPVYTTSAPPTTAARPAPTQVRQLPEPNPAIPEARQPPPPVVNLPPRSYTVVRGDTLYSIAWRYGFEPGALARANGIAPPYTIYPGQSVKLTDKPPAAPTIAAKPAPEKKSAPAKKVSAKAVAAKAPTTQAAAKPVPKTAKTSTKKPATRTAAPQPLPSGPIRWRWPTRGKVVRKFSGTVHKGIDIDGATGDKIVAVANGRVVYSGNGIVGYGNLLIVKHNDVYLSAYGHNSKLLVSEGESVTAGQTIAEKGSSATNSVKLHFEIRREGKPVDPIKLLPAR